MIDFKLFKKQLKEYSEFDYENFKLKKEELKELYDSNYSIEYISNFIEDDICDECPKHIFDYYNSCGGYRRELKKALEQKDIYVSIEDTYDENDEFISECDLCTFYSFYAMCLISDKKINK